VHWLPGERAENEDVDGALQEVDRWLRHGLPVTM
jgi:hypothetical protein